jgi:MoaA/NifB/PqqE/SkfB family radical SAM enzyme
VSGSIPETPALWKLTGRLIVNGFRYRLRHISGIPGKPQAVSLEITRRCIARCIMCNIWKHPPQTPELAAQDWLELLSSDLFSSLIELDITGGEPFLRKDLPELLQGICALKRRHIPDLRSIAITTNGFLTHAVLDYTRTILPVLRRAGVDLVMVCAMDGIGPVHDVVRNFSGGWIRADTTIQGLSRLREAHSNLIVGLKTTIVPPNVDHLESISGYAADNGLFTIISPCIVTPGRYLNVDRAQDLAFTAGQIRKMKQFFRAGATLWTIHDRYLFRFLNTGVIHKPCSCGLNYFFIRSNGDLYLCPLIDGNVGNIQHSAVKTLWRSAQAGRIRRRIGQFPACRTCTEPGLERYTLPCEGWTYLSQLFKLGKQRFLQMHFHMGMDKYLKGGLKWM